MSGLGLQRLAACSVGFVLAACSSSGTDDRSEGGGASANGGATAQGGSARGAAAGEGGSGSGGDGAAPPGGAGAEGGGQAGSAAREPRGACELGERVGRFSVEKQKDFGVVQGTVAQGVVPTSIPKLVLDQDGCQVFERRNLSCIPACEGTQTCGEDGRCIPFPLQVSVGEVTLDGLTKPIIMSPQKPGAVYFAPGQDNPPFSSTAQVVLRAAGAGGVAGFELWGSGSEPLDIAPTWELERDHDLQLQWPAPTASAGAHVTVELTIDQHGSSPLSVSCRLDDDGGGVIPKEIVNHLIDSGVSGFPNGRILRQTADHVDLDFGCVELTVGSTLPAIVRVAGFTPCMKDSDCAGGLTCNMALERCE